MGPERTRRPPYLEIRAFDSVGIYPQLWRVVTTWRHTNSTAGSALQTGTKTSGPSSGRT
jgi:hypothetical protein